MKITKEPYESALHHWPRTRRHILAHQQEDAIVVYQAFRPSTAAYAVGHQAFGGDTYSFNRMSWIKPNFLWMMYRCGWAAKEGQQRVLAITIGLPHFESILKDAVHAVYDHTAYGDKSAWQQLIKMKDVRLQWDPDHDPYGGRCARRAIQLGLKGDTLRQFGTTWVRHIEDITPFVHEQKALLDSHGLSALRVPAERVLQIDDPAIRRTVDPDEDTQPQKSVIL